MKACRVCGCTENRACVAEDGPCGWMPFPHQDLCTACASAASHIVSMTINALDLSVATCACGWCDLSSRSFPAVKEQDESIRQHWREVVERVRG